MPTLSHIFISASCFLNFFRNFLVCIEHRYYHAVENSAELASRGQLEEILIYSYFCTI